MATATLGGTLASSSWYTLRPSCLRSVLTRCGYRPACAQHSALRHQDLQAFLVYSTPLLVPAS